MIEDNHEQIVRRHYDAIAKRDLTAVLATLSDDIDWLFSGPAKIPFAGQRYGHEDVAAFFAAIRNSVEIRAFRIGELFQHQNKVIVF